MNGSKLFLVSVFGLAFGVSGPLYAKDYFLDGLISPKPVLVLKKAGPDGLDTSKCDIALYAPLLAESTGDTAKINDLILHHVESSIKTYGFNCKKYLFAWLAYNVMRADSFTSINLALYVRDRVGAHGGFDSIPITLDTKTNRVVTLKELFTSANYISIVNGLLVDSVLPALLKNGQEYDFQPITARQHFYLTEKDLVICYDPYEVAAGAAGIVEIPIPLDALRKHLKPRLASSLRP